MSLLRKDKRHLATDLGFHGNFSFPTGCQRQTKLSANLPIVFHSLSSFRGGVITNVPDAEGCQQPRRKGEKKKGKRMLIKHACFSYLPQRYHKRASFEEIDLAYKLHSFKDGRNFAKRWAANVVCDTLSLIDMTDTIFLCIPASCQHTHARRFKKFSAMVCQKLHAVNGYDYIHVIGKRPKAHISKTHELAENTDQYVQIDDEKLAGRNVVLFDDITTSCKTADAFIKRIQQAGAHVRLAIFLARTRTYKTRYN